MQQEPNIHDMRYFLEIAATGSLTRAAERIGISQPGISGSLTRLESACEAKLVHRQNTGITLTKAGDAFLREAKKILLHVDQLKRVARIAADIPTGTIRIGSHPALASRFFPTMLTEIYETYPDVSLELEHGLSRHLTDMVLAGELDFALVVNAVDSSSLAKLELEQDVIAVWSSGEGAEQRPESDTILYDPSMLQSREILKKLEKDLGRTFKRRLCSGHLDLIADLAQKGVGYAILPRSVSGPRGLVKVDATWPIYLDQIDFVYRKDLQPEGVASAIFACLAGN
ncbi:MAG: LysR family transcriptional regulator [Pseudobacteriovorax sp.]|nr:LysR family transcriptional regulator [Pseudobacteriovorax sp.]